MVKNQLVPEYPSPMFCHFQGFHWKNYVIWRCFTSDPKAIYCQMRENVLRCNFTFYELVLIKNILVSREGRHYLPPLPAVAATFANIMCWEMSYTFSDLLASMVMISGGTASPILVRGGRGGVYPNLPRYVHFKSSIYRDINNPGLDWVGRGGRGVLNWHKWGSIWWSVDLAPNRYWTGIIRSDDQFSGLPGKNIEHVLLEL